METTFNILRDWDFTTALEKSYFILVHIALLLLGIYSIKNLICGDNKTKARPASPLSQCSSNCQVNGKKDGNKQKDSKSDRDIVWAKEIASWFLNDLYSSDTINTWKAKMNARLLQNMTKGRVQIDYLNKDDMEFSVSKIRSYKPEIKEQMNIVVYFHIQKLEVKVIYTSENGATSSCNLILKSLSPLLHVQLVGFHGKIKTCLKLSFLNLDDFDLELDAKEINVKMIKESFRRSLQDSITLEATRGILKKEIKTEKKVKESSSQVNEYQFQEDSERRILVTDIDSAIAKVSSSNPQETENVVAKKNDDSPVQLNIALPSSSVSLMPEINVLPATPMSTDFDDSRMFIVENPSFAVQERPLPPQLESESSEIFEEKNSDMKSERKDEEVEGNKEKLSEEEVTSELNEESIEIKESLELQNDPSAEFEAKKESKEESKEENDEPFYGADKEIERSEGLITESNDNDVNDRNEGKACEETWHELPDSSSESSKDSSSLPKERKKGRPKSTSEIMLAHCNDIDHNLNEETHSSENESKKNIERVNTFHLGSKSMVSIASTPKRSDIAPLRATSSQLSLLSPVGYSPSKPSALIIETNEHGIKRHFHVPPAIARKGTYEQNGIKLHLYNGHIFIAQHFSKPLPLCAVCNLPLGRRIGKQGYQCRDCKAVTHKRCHNLIGSCEETSLSSMKIEYPWSTDV